MPLSSAAKLVVHATRDVTRDDDGNVSLGGVKRVAWADGRPVDPDAAMAEIRHRDAVRRSMGTTSQGTPWPPSQLREAAARTQHRGDRARPKAQPARRSAPPPPDDDPDLAGWRDCGLREVGYELIDDEAYPFWYEGDADGRYQLEDTER